MFRSVVLSGLAAAVGQQIGTSSPEQHPTMPFTVCTASGCTQETKSVVLDSNWRWIHDSSFKNCYTDSKWDTTKCPDPETCSKTCGIDGVDAAHYGSSYGVTSVEGGVQLAFVSKTQYGANYGSRLYLLDDESNYYSFKLLNKEFTFTVDVSSLPCGLNGALYFVEMDQDGGVASSNGLNAAGAKYGTGYCDAQCPHDMKFIKGLANVVDWNATSSPPVGKHGSCCAEMDIWEANSRAAAYTPHPCSITGNLRCEGLPCGSNDGQRYKGVCDKDGCDYNSYRLGAKKFFGTGADFKVDSTKPFTVVTQFITDDGTDTGDLVDIRRIYVQDGKVIKNSNASIAKLKGNSVTDQFCGKMKKAFGDVNDFKRQGGLKAMGEALGRGMVLVMSLWDDSLSEMLWLDSISPADASPSKPGVLRGPCPADETSNPTYVRANFPDAAVKYLDVRVGPLGSTFGKGAPPPAPAPSPVSPPSGSAGCAKAFQQCSGQDWTGPTCCAAGASCVVTNSYYSQCVPSGATQELYP